MKTKISLATAALYAVAGCLAPGRTQSDPSQAELLASWMSGRYTSAAEGFEGSTVGEGCASSLRGTSYATSEVFVADGVLASWDRGFDPRGRQVWGATAGPYLFLRD